MKKFLTLYFIVIFFYFVLENTIFRNHIFLEIFFKNSIWIFISLFLIVYQAPIFLGNFLFNIGKWDFAQKIYDYIVYMQIKNSLVYLNYGVILLHERKPKQAIKILEKTLNFGQNITIKKNVMLSIASCYWLLCEIDKAINILENMLKTFEYVNSKVLVTLGYMYFLKNNLDKAKIFSIKAIKDNKDEFSAYDNLGQIFMKKEDIPRAIKNFETAIKLKENVDSYYYLAMIKEKQEDIEKAILYYKKASSCYISVLNTVTFEQINEKIKKLEKVYRKIEYQK